MAGDWIKVEKATPRKPEVLRIAAALGLHPDHAFGLCFRFWSWCDDHLASANAVGVSELILDALMERPGFADALLSVGWLQVRNGSLEVPNFDRHLSQTAKKRAVTAQRVAKHKSNTNAKGNARSVTDALPSALPREEKRRVISNTDTDAIELLPESEIRKSPIPQTVMTPDAAIHAIEIDGDLVFYQEDRDRWTVAFVKWWNRLPGVHLWPFADLDDPLKASLSRRMLEPLWHWKLAGAEFPLESVSDWQPGLPWFLECGNVSKILGKKYKAGKEKPNDKRSGKTAKRNSSTNGPGQLFDPDGAAERGVNNF